MNNILKYGLRFSLDRLIGSGRSVIRPVLNSRVSEAGLSRTLWHMCSTTKINDNFLKRKPLNECCQCGCSGMIHTGGEKDLVEFLNDEIASEKKGQKLRSLPSELHGFSITTDMAELIFKKKTDFETITVTMNVNHSVDTEDTEDEGSMSEEMRARPSFEVDIERNNKTLTFACSYTNFNDPSHENTADSFEITEVSYFEGKWDEKVYSVAADLLDENLYDLFMVVLGEKGVTKEFIDKVSDIATSHEHSQYIGLLENVKKFASVN
ncbi:hypothetical protein RUM44_012687 [Polyplax serrata]|uniref:Complement component 1 Q subcomponent-binding protein, mitochondrial n=1 Tax=Polyplax serrata TaxID=468196 RepID=A0ABR1BGW9_POLSC